MGAVSKDAMQGMDRESEHTTDDIAMTVQEHTPIMPLTSGIISYL